MLQLLTCGLNQPGSGAALSHPHSTGWSAWCLHDPSRQLNIYPVTGPACRSRSHQIKADAHVRGWAHSASLQVRLQASGRFEWLEGRSKSIMLNTHTLIAENHCLLAQTCNTDSLFLLAFEQATDCCSVRASLTLVDLRTFQGFSFGC